MTAAKKPDFPPFTRQDFDMLNGSNTGANSVYKRLSLLRFAISSRLKDKGVECASVVAHPSVSRGSDIRKAGWLGFYQSGSKLSDASLSPLSGKISASVFLMGKGNFRGEEEGLQAVLEFGDGRRLDGEKDLFRRFLLASDYLSLAFLGGAMSLRLRGLPETTTALDSADSLVRFLKISSGKYETTKHYITIGKFYSVDEAASLGTLTAGVLADAVRKLYALMVSFTGKRV